MTDKPVEKPVENFADSGGKLLLVVRLRFVFCNFYFRQRVFLGWCLKAIIKV
jgi:hypothetical protein